MDSIEVWGGDMIYIQRGDVASRQFFLVGSRNFYLKVGRPGMTGRKTATFVKISDCLQLTCAK